MTPNEYQELALKTESVVFDIVLSQAERRVLHSIIGLVTESGELLDVYKKKLFYGKEVDAINIREEFGDLLWYIAIGLDACGYTMEQCMERNIEKLKQRYGEKFSSERAINRDLPAERNILEK